MPYIYTKRDGSQLKVSDEQLEKLKSNPTFDSSRLSRDNSQIANEAKKIIASNDDRQDTSERASRPDATKIPSLAEDRVGLGEALATAGKLPFRVLFPSTVRSAEEAGNNDITLKSLLSGAAESVADFVPAGKIASAPLRVGVS